MNRDGRIRTGDPLNPIQVRYRTAPRPAKVHPETYRPSALPSYRLKCATSREQWEGLKVPHPTSLYFISNESYYHTAEPRVSVPILTTCWPAA